MGAFLSFVAIVSILVLVLAISWQNNQKVTDKDSESYELPLTDSSGRKFKNIWHINISGVTHLHNGCNPQIIIPHLPIGSKLVLKPEPNNEYDKRAIKVLTASGKYIGWYPAKGIHHEDVFARLLDGEEVNVQLSNKGKISGSNRWWCEMKVIIY